MTMLAVPGHGDFGNKQWLWAALDAGPGARAWARATVVIKLHHWLSPLAGWGRSARFVLSKPFRWLYDPRTCISPKENCCSETVSPLEGLPPREGIATGNMPVGNPLLLFPRDIDDHRENHTSA
jgi:hypothetical protein